MKKILFSCFVLLASFSFANAQQVKDANENLASAIKNSENPKKAQKASTWMDLGKAYIDVHDAYLDKITVGMNLQTLALILKDKQVLAQGQEEINGNVYNYMTYQYKTLYFNNNGALVAVRLKNDQDVLQKAAEAYFKAYDIDKNAKHSFFSPSKTKDIAKALEALSKTFNNDAYNYYQLADYKKSGIAFEWANKVIDREPVNKIDTSAIYNVAFLATSVKDNERAKAFLKRCYELGYYSKDGEIFPKLAEVDPDNAKQYLEEGFTKFPQSQAILIGLINYYITKSESTDRLFELLDQAKKNEPNNASLYYVEGNIHAKLGQVEKAIAAYDACAKINPEYEYGYIGKGVLFYNKALELQDKAQNEMDDAKYRQLNEEFEKVLMTAVEPFEKAFNVAKDIEVKKNIAQYLKNIYFRFRDQEASYMEKYKMYDEFEKNGK